MKNVSNLVSADVYLSLGEMFENVKLEHSWRSKIPTQDGFSKESKEAFNAIIFAIIKEIMLNKDEDLSGLPAYILKRLYKKAYTWDAKPSNTRFFRNNIYGFDAALEGYVSGNMKAEGVDEFSDFLDREAAKVSKKAENVYRAARMLGTLIEYEEMQDKMRADTVEETRQEVYGSLLNFKDEPHFMEIALGLGEYHDLKILLKAISAGRYTFRWQGYNGRIGCSILDHMLESAIIGYLANLETGRDTDILKDFWVLLFHDIAEIWTDDIPSPVKDGVRNLKVKKKLADILNNPSPSLRDISELQELEALETHFYARLPEHVAKFFKEGVMLEDVKDPEVKKFYKMADYFSADLEVAWNIKAGSEENRFFEILLTSAVGDRRTEQQKKMLKGIVKNYVRKAAFDTLLCIVTGDEPSDKQVKLFKMLGTEITEEFKAEVRCGGFDGMINVLRDAMASFF